MQTHLDQLVKKFWKPTTYKSWDILFKEKDTDYNLYYIESWNVSLEKNWYKVISLGCWEIIWEKSFFQKQVRPLDARIIEDDTIIYCLEIEQFENLSQEDKDLIYSQMVLFLSWRVYKLNDILSSISYINEQILQYSIDFDKEILTKLFNKFIDLKGYAVLKYEYWEIHKVYAEMIIDSQILVFVQTLIDNETDIKVWQNYIFIRSNEYIYLLFGSPTVEYYILSNTLLYVKSIFKYLWEKIEADRNKQFLQDL